MHGLMKNDIKKNLKKKKQLCFITYSSCLEQIEWNPLVFIFNWFHRIFP